MGEVFVGTRIGAAAEASMASGVLMWRMYIFLGPDGLGAGAGLGAGWKPFLAPFQIFILYNAERRVTSLSFRSFSCSLSVVPKLKMLIEGRDEGRLFGFWHR